jgi:hypothetical protein
MDGLAVDRRIGPVLDVRGKSRTWVAVEARALELWPRLDQRALRRCRQDARRIARLVSRRSALPFETILGMLLTRVPTEEEAQDWFG